MPNAEKAGELIGRYNVSRVEPTAALMEEYKFAKVRYSYIGRLSRHTRRRSRSGSLISAEFEVLTPRPTPLGDGNCYYRSVAYAYLERLVCKGEKCLDAFLTLYPRSILTLRLQSERDIFNFKSDRDKVQSVLVNLLNDVKAVYAAHGDRAALLRLHQSVCTGDEYDHVSY